MKKIKILYVINNANFLMSHRRNLLESAKNKGYIVHVAAPKTSSINEIEEMGCIFHSWRLSRKGVNPVEELMAIRSLYKIYQAVKPDLIHHVTIKPIIYGGLAARFAKIPATINAVSGLGHVYISESLKTKLIRMITNWGYAISAKHPGSRFIFQNRDDEQFFIEKRLVEKNKSHIILGAGVCMKHFQPLKMPPLDKIILVLAARMIKEKGVLEFIEAARLLAENKKLKFVLVGDIDPGNPSSLTIEEIEAPVREGIIEWWEYQKDMHAVFSKCHVVCLPSYREGSPRVLIEAAASGRPIITTDTPGCCDLVKRGVNGFLIPIKNSLALANAVEKITENPSLLSNMGMESRALVERQFAQEIVLSQTLNIYQSLHH